MEPIDPFLGIGGCRSPVENGVMLACGLLEATNEGAVDLIYRLDEQDIRDVALVLIASQHIAMREDLESLFGDKGVHLSALARTVELERRCEALDEIAGRMSQSLDAIAGNLSRTPH